MKTIMQHLKLHGRTLWDEERQALFCNWTCSGISVKFSGSVLKAKLVVMEDAIPSPPGFPPTPDYYPCVGVVVDGGELENRQEIRENGLFTLWEGEAGEHTLRFVKLSENSRGKLGIQALVCDGQILPAVWEEKPVMEIIGDSITCGFGNESSNNSPEFLCSEENGWITYGALAARELGYEWRQICVSGISASQPEHPMFPMAGMNEIYHLTDQLYAQRTGTEAACWDFENHKTDIVVLNLGTNDVNPIRFTPDFGAVKGMEAWFFNRYREFVADIRRLNGPDTWIVCTLGSMDYYLFDQIKAAVESYKAETGDEKIACFKFGGINMMTEGFGAMAHPSAATHARMGRELAFRLRELGIVKG